MSAEIEAGTIGAELSSRPRDHLESAYYSIWQALQSVDKRNSKDVLLARINKAIHLLECAKKEIA